MASKPLHKHKPGVRKIWLHLTAGLMWLGAGIMLVGFASRWLKLVSISTLPLFVLAGIALGVGIHWFGFSKLAKKNIRRINSFAGERVCLLAFQEWKSYPLVAVMIALGIYLRIYSPIPKPILAIVYLGIGSGLFFSSLVYFEQVIRAMGFESFRIKKHEDVCS